MFNEDYVSFTGDTGDFELLQKDENFANLLQLFPNVNSILVPKKAEYNLRKYVSKKALKEIDPDINIALEKCLLMLSNLSITKYFEESENPENRWKPLSSEILHEQTRNKDNTYLYRKIVEVLKEGTKDTGAIIEVIEDYGIGTHSKKYRLADAYFRAGLIPYIIKDSKIIQRRNKLYYKLLNEAFENPICRNLIQMYQRIDLPTAEELLVIGKQLVKEKHTTKKGKKLTMRNKHNNDYWSDFRNRSFVEDNIELFEYLTKRGFMIPIIGDEKSGGRVVDSFTLMPSWIRNEITIDGKKLSECDYIALHPNIAIRLYNGKLKFITHENIAEQTGINIKEVKIEHLSFFNKEWGMMAKSPIYGYYFKNELEMLEQINKDKRDNGYKITSQKMFKAEVDIMSDVIKHLNSIGITVLYVYDALLCEEKDKALVVETMNRIILEHGVCTNVKVEAEIEKIVETGVEKELEQDSNELLSKEEIKKLLRVMINRFEYENQKSAINYLLDDIDNKPLKLYNELYHYINDKEIINLNKTG